MDAQYYIDRMRKILAGEIEPEYEDLYDVISFDNFSWPDWLRDEKAVLEPQLTTLGYTDIQQRCNLLYYEREQKPRRLLYPMG